MYLRSENNDSKSVPGIFYTTMTTSDDQVEQQSNRNTNDGGGGGDDGTNGTSKKEETSEQKGRPSLPNKTEREKSSCCSRCLRWERIVCSTGNAWGYLDGKDTKLLAAWWLLRHLFYFGVVTVLLLWVPNSAYFVVPFFIFVHGYKALRLLWAPTTDGDGAERSKREILMKRQQQQDKIRRARAGLVVPNGG